MQGFSINNLTRFWYKIDPYCTILSQFVPKSDPPPLFPKWRHKIMSLRRMDGGGSEATRKYIAYRKYLLLLKARAVIAQ
jgi:hypothetical protein